MILAVANDGKVVGIRFLQDMPAHFENEEEHRKWLSDHIQTKLTKKDGVEKGYVDLNADTDIVLTPLLDPCVIDNIKAVTLTRKLESKRLLECRYSHHSFQKTSTIIWNERMN